MLLALVLIAACRDGTSPLAPEPTMAMGPAPRPPRPPELGVPLLPFQSYAYADATAPLPRHFTSGPAGFPTVLSTDNTPRDNAITDAGATLGRVLFYDRLLSANRTQSCGSCHQQALGFTDAARVSVGVTGATGEYHAPALGNARFYSRGRFFWDERAATLEAQVLLPVSNPVEMNLPLEEMRTRITAAPYYAALYRAAFGTPEVTLDRTARALAQFVRALRSTTARYDRAVAAPPAPGGAPNFAAIFSAQELRGQQLFAGTAGCARCHATHAQVLDAPANTGLDATITDEGAGEGRFKAPSLRNVAVRGHFMHDGRFTTLEQVVDFYDHGVQPNPSLDLRLRGPDGRPRRLGLSVTDKAALVAFLKTLTDEQLLTDVRYSNPFPR